MKHPRGPLIARAEREPSLRYVRAIGIPTMVVGEALVAYLLSRGLARLSQEGFTPTITVAVGLLIAAFTVTFLYLVISVRIGPHALYQDGLDLRDSALVLSRSFFPWQEFTEARVETLGRAPASITRIVLERRGNRKPFTLSSALVDPAFVEALARFLEDSKVVPTKRE